MYLMMFVSPKHYKRAVSVDSHLSMPLLLEVIMVIYIYIYIYIYLFIYFLAGFDIEETNILLNYAFWRKKVNHYFEFIYASNDVT